MSELHGQLPGRRFFAGQNFQNGCQQTLSCMFVVEGYPMAHPQDLRCDDFTFGEREEEPVEAWLDARLTRSLDLDEAHVWQRCSNLCSVGKVDLTRARQGNDCKARSLDHDASFVECREQDFELRTVRSLNPVLHFQPCDSFTGGATLVDKALKMRAFHLDDFNERNVSMTLQHHLS